MISISINIIALNDDFAIADEDLSLYQRILDFRRAFSWIFNFFKSHLNFFKYLYNLYGYMVTAFTVVYYCVVGCVVGLVLFYGFRIIAALTKFFWHDIRSYFSQTTNNIQLNTNPPQITIQNQALNQPIQNQALNKKGNFKFNLRSFWNFAIHPFFQVSIRKIRHSEANKALMRNWLSTHISTRRNEKNLSLLVESTGLSHFQVYDFLKDETTRIKKRNNQNKD